MNFVAGGPDVKTNIKYYKGMPIFIKTYESADLFYRTCARFCEVIDDPYIGNNYFDHEEHCEHFMVMRGEDYRDVIQGVNFGPLNLMKLDALIAAARKDYTQEEKNLLYELQNNGVIRVNGSRLDILQDFYVVAISPVSTNYTIDHELMHAVYHFDPAYRRYVQDIWNLLSEDFKERTRITFQDCNYNPDVFIDEFQAYATDPDEYPIPVLEEQDRPYLVDLADMTKVLLSKIH